MLIPKTVDTCRRRREKREWIDESAKRFHQRTGVYLSGDEAIKQIRELRTKYYFPAKRYFPKREIEKRSNLRSMCSEIIRLITSYDSEYDPIKVIYELYDFFDDMGPDAIGARTWDYIRISQDSILEILTDLRS